jgi:hypothetical protein
MSRHCGVPTLRPTDYVLDRDIEKGGQDPTIGCRAIDNSFSF